MAEIARRTSPTPYGDQTGGERMIKVQVRMRLMAGGGKTVSLVEDHKLTLSRIMIPKLQELNLYMDQAEYYATEGRFLPDAQHKADLFRAWSRDLAQELDQLLEEFHRGNRLNCPA